ncbi:MAG: hypothetical protein KDA42_01335 [Planctomycetales bacterium]|nr:hypothetical protein [Planctomycetales bacterium]
MSAIDPAKLANAVELYIQSLIIRRRSANYILRARNYLDQLSDFLGAEFKTANVSHADLQRFVDEKDIAYTTAGGIRDLLNACLSNAVKAGLEDDLRWFSERAAEAAP